MTTTTRDWMATPVVDLHTRYGPVQASFTEGDHVSVRTTGHINEDLPVLTYRGRDYLLHVHLYGSLGWNRKPGYAPHCTSRDNWSACKAPTIIAALVDACREAVIAYLAGSPDTLRQAEYADANNRLQSLDRELAEAETLVSEIQAAINAQVARMEASA